MNKIRVPYKRELHKYATNSSAIVKKTRRGKKIENLETFHAD